MVRVIYYGMALAITQPSLRDHDLQHDHGGLPVTQGWFCEPKTEDKVVKSPDPAMAVRRSETTGRGSGIESRAGVLLPAVLAAITASYWAGPKGPPSARPATAMPNCAMLVRIDLVSPRL